MLLFLLLGKFYFQSSSIVSGGDFVCHVIFVMFAKSQDHVISILVDFHFIQLGLRGVILEQNSYQIVL